MRRICSHPAPRWHGIRSATARPPFAQASGMYYSLIDDLASCSIRCLPRTGRSFVERFAAIDHSVLRQGIAPLQQCGPGIPSANACIYVAPKECSPTRKLPQWRSGISPIEQQLDRNMSLRASYVGSFGYHGLVSIDPNDIPAQICAIGRLHRGRHDTGTTEVGGAARPVQGAQYIPVGTRPNPYYARDSSGTRKATPATTRCKST